MGLMSELQPTLTPNGNLHVSDQEPFSTPNGVAYINEVAPFTSDPEEPPLLISPGLLNSSSTMFPVMDEFASRGIRTIAIEHARRGHRVKNEVFAEAASEYSGIEAAKAETLLNVIENRRLGPVDLLGYCEGAVNGAALATRYPDKIRNFVLLNPAGMMGEDSFLRVFKVFVDKSLKDVKHTFERPSQEKEESSETSRASLLADRLLGLPTLYHLARARIDSDLTELQHAGVNVAVLQSYRDSLYPYYDVAKHVPEEITYTSLANRKLGHAAIYTHREVVVGATVRLLKSMSES